MKNIVKFLRDQRGVSPVIGVILMVAITVVLAAVVAGFVYGYIGTTTKAPNVVLSAVDDPADNNSLLIKHNGGESIGIGDWKYSVTSPKESITDFDSGGSLMSTGWVGDVTGTETDGSGTITSGTWYHVVVVHVPSDSLLLDTNVLVR